MHTRTRTFFLNGLYSAAMTQSQVLAAVLFNGLYSAAMTQAKCWLLPIECKTEVTSQTVIQTFETTSDLPPSSSAVPLHAQLAVLAMHEPQSELRHTSRACLQSAWKCTSSVETPAAV